MRSTGGESRGSDHDLVRAFQSGDGTAFDELVLRHQDLVFNLCVGTLGSRDEADDASQETFVKVFRALKGFRFASSFTTWLYRIAVNTCKNRLSSLAHRMKRKSLSLDAEGPDGNRIVPEQGDEKWSPSVLAERTETRKAILAAIAGLPEDQRILVVLADIEERPYDEIASITGLNQGTVKSKLSRARQVLRERLREVV
jgi:RNA polymerase sigma-70 factor (ECF subfamily)